MLFAQLSFLSYSPTNLGLERCSMYLLSNLLSLRFITYPHYTNTLIFAYPSLSIIVVTLTRWTMLSGQIIGGGLF